MIAPMKVGHGTRSSLEFIKRKRPRFFSLTEMDLGRNTAISVIRAVFGALVHIFTEDRGGHSQEIPGVFRRVPWARGYRFTLHQLSDDGGPAVGGMGNDRWLGELRVKVFTKTYAFFFTHVDAGVQHVAAGRQLGQLLQSAEGRKRWARYQIEMEKIETLVGRAIADTNTDVVILQGDLNMLPVGDGITEHYAPHQVYKRLRMQYVNSRVVYFGVHGAKIKKHAEFPPGHDGWMSDHGALMAWI